MKKPELKDLNQADPAAADTVVKPDAFREAQTEASQQAAQTVRRTFSFEQYLSEHIDAVALQMSQEAGKTVNASQALRAILKRDMQRLSS